ncbi:tetratricopeptide repeat protein [Anaeramoeba flamelloides]|uniref:Tetratricopeptide repeat protein 29 n=1 Tax=Anaeramoeba flamelloides TaxID=1746091 RepID=A0ABQ8Z2K8_9EUKA|nr:tetratricopeptide repeat protein [Anaeramoeba flamelloides]
MLSEFFTFGKQFTRIFQPLTLKPFTKKIQFNLESHTLGTKYDFLKKNSIQNKYYFSSFINKQASSTNTNSKTTSIRTCEEYIKLADQDSLKGEHQNAFNNLLSGLKIAIMSDDLPNHVKILGKMTVCSQLQLKNPEYTMKYAKLWSKEASELKDYDAFANAMVFLFLASCARKEHETALKSLQDFESVAINLEKDANTKGSRFGRLGLLWRAVGQKGKAIECFKSGVSIVLNPKNFQLGQIHRNKGKQNEEVRYTQTKRIALDLLQELYQIQINTQEIEHAVETNEKRLVLLRDGGSKESLLSLLQEHGYMLNLMNWDDQSLEIYQEALQMSVELGKVAIETKILVKLGEILAGKDETIDRAISHLERATKLAKQIGNDQLQTKATELIGNTYYKNGKFALCIQFLDNLISNSTNNNSEFSKDLVSLNLGRSYLEIGEIDKARKLLHEVLQMNGENDVPIVDIQQNKIDLNSYYRHENSNSSSSTSSSDPNLNDLPRNVRIETINFNAYLSLMRVEDRSGNYKLSSWYGQQALIISQRTTVDHTCTCDDDDSKISHRGATEIEIFKELIPIYLKAKKFKLAINSIENVIETMKNIKNPDTVWRNYLIQRAIGLIIEKNLLKKKLDFFLSFAINESNHLNDFKMELFYLFLLQRYTPNSNNKRAKELMKNIQNIQMPKISNFKLSIDLNEWHNWLSSLKNL